MSGKVPAQLPPGDISFTTLRDAAATGHIPAFRNALAMAGQSQDEIEYAVEYLTKQPRGPKGRFLKPLSPDQRGAKYKEYLDELVGGRPAGNIPNVDVLTTAIRKTTENVPETVEEIVEDLGKLAPPEGVPPDVAKYLGSVQAKGADLTKMGERAGARKPFLKPAGVGQRTHVPNTIAQFDTLISRDIQASGVPKRVREAIMGVSRKPVPGVTPLTQAERVVLGKQLMDGKTTFAKKWINMMKQSTKKPKVAKKKAGFLDEKGAIELVPEDIKTDFSPLTGESGVLMLNRLTEYLNEDQLAALAEKLGVDHFKKKAGNILPLWYNALLMNPATMLRNLLGNTFEFAEQLVTRTAKGVLRASPRQALAQWSGFGHGLTNAFASAGEAWRTGLIKAVRTGEEEFVEELPSDITKYMPASKVMSWMDDFFTTLGYNMDLQDRIYRRAAQSSKNTMDEVIRMNSEVPEDLAESSMRAARRVVYRDFVEPGGFNHKVLKTIRSYQDIPFWGRFTLPFGRTPYMIGKRVVEYTPLNYFTGAYNIMAGGLGSQQAEQGIEQILRSMYGTAAMTSLYYLAKGGLITGEMQNLTEAQRDAVRASGVQPMSVKIGDQWITYRNLGPVSALFQFVGNTYEDVESGKYSPEEIAVKGPANLMGAAVDSTFLPELSNIVAAMTDPDRYGKRGLSQLTSYLQPITGVAALARAVDPKVREFDKLDPEQVFASKTPGLSQYLRPRLGLFGEELLRTATSDPGIAEQVELFVSPVRRKQISNDPVITEVARLQASMGAPSMDLKIESLTEEDKWVASKAMGMAQKQFVTRVMNSPFYARLPDDRKRAVLEKAHGKGRRFVNNRVNALSRQGKSITYRALLKGLVAE
jgi:hypothetical protein